MRSVSSHVTSYAGSQIGRGGMLNVGEHAFYVLAFFWGSYTDSEICAGIQRGQAADAKKA